MGENMVSDESIKVLSERIGSMMDLLKTLQQGMEKTNDRLDAFQALQISSATQGVQLANLEAKQIAQQTTLDELFRLLDPLRDEVAGNKKAWRVVGAIAIFVPSALGFGYSQWHPWTEYTDTAVRVAKDARDGMLKQYQFDVGQELRRDDNRLTVLEFRANNIDNKASK